MKKKALIITFLSAILLLFGVTKVDTLPIGAELPSTVAVFETSLQAPITSSATSMTLTANSIRGGGSVSGYTCFTLDEGNTNAETVCGTVSGTSVTSLQRGISQANGTTTVSALQFSHRRGANVKITDFPIIQLLKAQNNGEETFENLLSYATTTGACSDVDHLCDKAYIDAAANQGAATATEAVAGIAILATQAQMSSSADLGADDPLVIQAKYSTSSPDVRGIYNIISDATGYLDQAWLKLTEHFSFSSIFSTYASSTYASTTYIGLNGIDYLFPASEGSNGTVLTTDGSGGLSWAAVSGGTTAADEQSYDTTIANTASETTFASTTISAGALGTEGMVVWRIPIIDFDWAEGGWIEVDLKIDGTTVDTLIWGDETGSNNIGDAAATTNANGWVDIEVWNNGSASSQAGIITMILHSSANAFTLDKPADTAIFTSSVDTSGAVEMTLTGTWSAASASNRLRVSNSKARLYSSP